MERSDTKVKRRENIQIILLILIGIAIAALIFTAVVLIKNADEIKKNPVAYAIDKDFFESCSCTDGRGGWISFPKSDGGVIQDQSS